MGRLLIIAGRQPPRCMRREDHAVGLGRDAVLNRQKGIVQDGAAEKAIFRSPPAKGVPHHRALRGPVHAVKDRGRCGGERVHRQARQHHEGVGLRGRSFREIAIGHLIEVVGEIAGEGVVPARHHDHDISHLLHGAAVTGREGVCAARRPGRRKVILGTGQCQRQQQKRPYESLTFHQNYKYNDFY